MLIEKIKENILLIILFLIIGGSGFYFLVIHPAMRIKSVPKFEKAFVVAKGKDDKFATDEFKTYKTKDEPVLYAVVAAKKKGDDKLTYFTEAENLKIEGKVIDKDRIEKWDTFKWKEVRIFWFKIEPVMKHVSRNEEFSPNNVMYYLNFQNEWPFTWTHKLDVNGFKATYPRQNLGTMRFKIRAEIKVSSAEFVEKVMSAGEDEIEENGFISDKVFKATIIPEDSYFGNITSLINLAYAKKIDYEKFDTIKKAIAIDTAGYYTKAGILSGFKDVKLGDMESLLKHFKPIYSDLKLDKEKGIYVDKFGKVFETSNLKKGYIFKKGNLIGVYAGEGSMEIGKLKFLSSDDRVLMSRDLPLYYEKIGDFFDKDFQIGIFQ